MHVVYKMWLIVKLFMFRHSEAALPATLSVDDGDDEDGASKAIRSAPFLPFRNS